MIKREREGIYSAPHIYSPDPWRISENQFYPELIGLTETIFCTSNGYIGMRGAFEEGKPSYQNFTIVNGFYETWPIIYGEEAFGFTKMGQTIVNVPDSRIIKLYVDDEPFYLPTATLVHFERFLDMRNGVVERNLVWEMFSGKQISIRSKRLVSLEHRHLAAISYEVTVLNDRAPVVISSEIVDHENYAEGDEERRTHGNGGDPRRASRLEHRVLEPGLSDAQDTSVILCHSTRNSKMTITSGIEHTLETNCNFSYTSRATDDRGKVGFMVDARKGEPINLTKYMTYHTTRTAPHTNEELRERARRSLKRAKKFGFSDLLEGQRKYLDEFWERSDVRVEMDSDEQTVSFQQAIRFGLFQMYQSSARVEGAGVPSKGLTGVGYDGHYFWDMEIYLMPFLIYTSPTIAENLLKFRYSMLDKAREYAKRLNQKGAMFPWRTINGEEASAYYAAGTAQYHINADIVYALRKYVNVTGDQDFIFKYGAEILIETARLWSDLGFYSNSEGEKFEIHGVTGPDEYNTVVNNNTYTNLMARENLRLAAATVERLKETEPELFKSLAHKTDFRISEINGWKKAARHMYIPYDKKLGIHPQDNYFLEKEKWDFENVPEDKYPILLHYHPLVIYRHRVVKQSDLVLAMFLLEKEFSREEQRRNFDYYDPLTTGDSSLSACIQGTVAAKAGRMDKAMEYAENAVFMDLGDMGRNTVDGCHIASMGGTWMMFMFGFAGLANTGESPEFSPNLPEEMLRLNFSVTILGNLIEVDLNHSEAKYTLKKGDGIALCHSGVDFEISPESPTFLTKN
ncbi:MAG: glycoside hydrolase family 65 protein [Candidatus Dadabacteria bacterium]|nr:glycoside hydrolase family 65 protein [Candidatus Dadabacteria bacterium]